MFLQTIKTMPKELNNWHYRETLKNKKKILKIELIFICFFYELLLNVSSVLMFFIYFSEKLT